KKNMPAHLSKIHGFDDALDIDNLFAITSNDTWDLILGIDFYLHFTYNLITMVANDLGATRKILDIEILRYKNGKFLRHFNMHNKKLMSTLLSLYFFFLKNFILKIVFHVYVISRSEFTIRNQPNKLYNSILHEKLIYSTCMYITTGTALENNCGVALPTDAYALSR
ncbi:hypothetical protein ACJX0J_035242, partial [Zea mays]